MLRKSVSSFLRLSCLGLCPVPHLLATFEAEGTGTGDKYEILAGDNDYFDVVSR